MLTTLSRADAALTQLCPNPIFIIGSPRSGTSILAWSLAQHSQLWASGELHLIHGLFGTEAFDQRVRREQALPEGFMEEERVDRAELLRYLGMGVNALITNRSGGKRWIEQTPLYAVMVDRLLEMFPGAYFLHILRDGRAVVNSMMNFSNALPDGQREILMREGWYPEWATDFATACSTWSSSVESAMDFSRLHPDRCLTISYRQLVGGPEEGFRAIARFLGVPQEDGPAEHFRTNRLHSSVIPPSEAGAPPPLASEPWLAWTPEQRRLFTEIAAPTLIRYGLASGEEIATWNDAVRRREVEEVRRVVQNATPIGARIVVASRGDDDLVTLADREGWHFPQEADGVYAGHYPADSAEAITRVEALRARGAEFLLLPPSARWWLDHYAGLHAHLETLYLRLPDQAGCVLFDLRPPRPLVPREEPAAAAAGVVHVELADEELVEFVCNVCGAPGSIARASLDREGRSCMHCGSSVRWRSVVHALSTELFGESVHLPDFPVRKELVGLGMTDWPGYADTLAARFSYTNTFYDQEPKFDIMAEEVDPRWAGKCDFVISSDVLEHVAPPVSIGFVNMRRLLKPDGVLVLTVPYNACEETREHYPDLFDYRIVEEGGEHVLINRTRDGVEQRFGNLVFHGGPGAVLEMRQFGEGALLKELEKAGFDRIRVHSEPVMEHAIYCNRCWPTRRSFTISARARKP